MCVCVCVCVCKRFMGLTNAIGKIIEDQMLQYYQIVLNINDRAYIYIYIYIYI